MRPVPARWQAVFLHTLYGKPLVRRRWQIVVRFLSVPGIYAIFIFSIGRHTMDPALSEAKKKCPDCGTALPIRMMACQCGHVFESSPLPPPSAYNKPQDTEYEAYLFARLDQARMAAERAIELLNKQPDDPARLRAAEKATDQLSQLNRKVDRIKPAPSTTDKERDQRIARQQQARRKAMDEANAIRMAHRKAAETAHPAHLIGRPARMHSIGLPESREQRRQQEMERADHGGRVRLPSSAAIEARRADQRLIADRARAHARRRTGTDEDIPGTLRQDMSHQAAAALARVRESNNVIASDLVAANTALHGKQATEGFRKTQQKRAEGIGSKECPHCTARVDLKARLCACGYSFTNASDSMPGVTAQAASDSPITVFDKPRLHRR